MRRLLAPLTARVGERMATSRVAPIGRRVAGTETGVLLGYLSQRVLGQYDLLVLDDDAAADAVYYVGGNVLALEKRFAFRPRDFRLWIAIHEVTHRAQFTGVPWMKPYYLSLVERALSSIDPDPRRLVQALARAADEFRSGRNPLDDGGLVALLASDEQRGALARRAGADVAARGSRQRGDEPARPRARRRAGPHGAGAPGPPAEHGHGRVPAEAGRARVEDAPVRGGRGVRRRGRAGGRAPGRSTPPGAAPSTCPPSTSSPARSTGSPGSTHAGVDPA